MKNIRLNICNLDNMSRMEQNKLIKQMSEGMNQDVFIDPNKSNLLKIKKTFVKKLAKKTKQEIYMCIGQIILNATENTEFWYLDYDDPVFTNNLYYECYHFSEEMLNKLQDESIINNRDRLVEIKHEANQVNTDNIVCFAKTRRFSMM